MKRTVLITGATDGIGKQTAIELAAKGFDLIIHGRNKDRVDSTVAELQNVSRGSFVIGFVCNLGSMNSVRKMGAELKENFETIDILINNAGVYMNELVLTEDGFESTFAINHLSHFLLTNLLLDQIKKSKDGRIINVSSVAHKNARLDWDNLNAEKLYSPYGAYALSKLANLLFSNELAFRLRGTAIKSNALHPGVISTKLLKTGFNIRGAPVQKGAETSVYLASSDEVAGITGEYFVDRKISNPLPIVHDSETTNRFWKLSAAMAGI